MALYLGRDRVDINLGGILYRLNLLSNMPIYDGVKLLSSDGYILQDSTGLYLVPIDYIEPVLENIMLSSDNYILTDSNGIILLPSDSVTPIISGVMLSSDNYILTDSNGIYLAYKEE